MPWPTVGELLPRVEDAYSKQEKWSDWILSEEHHGPEWRTVFGSVDAETIWAALTGAILVAPVVSARRVADGGVSCGVDVLLTLNGRRAIVRSAWHYAHENDAP